MSSQGMEQEMTGGETVASGNLTSPDGYSLLETVVIAVVAGILSLLTILGNVMVLVSFKMDKQLQTISNYFLLSLAVADFFIGLISMPLYTLYLLMNRWPLGAFVCDSWLAFDYLNSNASVLNLLIISFDRYFSVTRPLTYRVRRTTKRACLMIASTWFISLLLWPPWIFAWPYIEGNRSIPENECYIQFLETNPYLTFGTAIAAFYIPVTVMCFLYWRIWRETEKRYKDLTTLFLVSAVGGRVRSAPGHSATPADDPSGRSLKEKCRSFVLWPLRVFKSEDDDEDDVDETDVPVPRASGQEQKRKKRSEGKKRGEERTTASTTEDEEEEEELETTSEGGTSSGTDRTKKSTLASDSIYTILITLGESKGPSHVSHPPLTTPTTTSSAALTPVAESDYLVNPDDPLETTHSIKQFFESAIVTRESVDMSAADTPDVKPCHKSEQKTTTSTHAPYMKKQSSKESTRGGRSTRSSSMAHSSSNRPLQHSTVSQPKSEKKAAKTLSAILLAFIITWTPYNVLVLIKTLSSDRDDLISETLWNFSYYLCYINSTINPFCYALCNVNFRNTYLRILKCQWTQGTTRQRARDAQFDLPPAQSKKSKRRDKKRRKERENRALNTNTEMSTTTTAVKTTVIRPPVSRQPNI